MDYYRWIIDGLFRIILALHSTVSEQTCEPCVLLRCWKPRVWGWDCFCLLSGCFMNVLRMFFLDVQWCLVALRGRCQGHSSGIRTAGSLEWRLSCAGTLATVQGRVVSAIGSDSCPTKCLDLRFAVSILHALKMECSKMECRAVWVFLILWPKWISEFDWICIFPLHDHSKHSHQESMRLFNHAAMGENHILLVQGKRSWPSCGAGSPDIFDVDLVRLVLKSQDLQGNLLVSWCIMGN